MSDSQTGVNMGKTDANGVFSHTELRPARTMLRCLNERLGRKKKKKNRKRKGRVRSQSD